MPNPKQSSFAAGEISGQMAGRADQAKHASGLKTCRNFITTHTGSAVNRAGTRYLGAVKTAAKKTRVIPFVFANSDSFVLEFGNLYVRFYRNRVRNRALYASGNTPTWLTATAYTPGKMTTRLLPVYVCILAHTSSAATEPAVGANWQTYWYALPSEGGGFYTYELPTPYLEADLFDITYVQSGDVVTLCHPNYAPRELKRWGTYEWELSAISFAPTIGTPTGVAAAGSAGATTQAYVVTAVTPEGEESVPGTAIAGGTTQDTIDGITLTSNSDVTLTVNGHPFAHGAEVRITGIVGTTQLNNRNFFVNVVNANTLRLSGEKYLVREVAKVDTPTHSPWVSGGTVTLAISSATAVAAPSSGTPITVTWAVVADAVEYNVYRKKNGTFGYVGTTKELSFIDDGVVPDLSVTAPRDDNPFASPADYPACVGYFQQRQVFGGSHAYPEKVWPSQVGAYHNLSARSPALDDDAFSFTIAGQRLNRIRHMVDIGKLVLLTEGGEWTVQGDGDGVLRPTAVNLHQEGYSGIWKTAPIVVGNAAVFVSGRGNAVRGLRYDFSTDGFPSNDLTIYARHLFDGYTIDDWTYALVPYGVLWAVRSDGTLLGLTLLPEQDVIGWHRHDTSGDAFESVCCVPEDGADTVYVVVRRTVGGATVRYIECFESRRIDAVAADAWFVDSGAAWDGRYSTFVTASGAVTPASVTLTGGTLWDSSETLTLSDLDVGFTSPTLGSALAAGDQLVLTLNGVETRLDVLSYNSGTATASVRPSGTVPVAMRGVAIADWAWARASMTSVAWVSGSILAGSSLAHLNGRTVAILGDGDVRDQAVVTGSAVTLSPPAVHIRVGLPITADLELLDLEDPQGETLLGKKKLTVEAAVQVHASLGVYAGPDSDNLQEYIQREGEDWEETTELATGVIELGTTASWNNHGRLFIRQSDPLPLEVLAAVRRVVLGGR